MESAFRIWTTNRSLYLDYLDKYSLEQLNTVPPGFSNNLIWNIAHVVVAQQRLVYGASGLPMNVSDEFFNRFKPGTRPNTTEPQETVEILKNLLSSQIDETKADYVNGKFVSYNAFTTSMGFKLASLEDGIEYNNYHEAMHLGFMMNIRKFV